MGSGKTTPFDEDLRVPLLMAVRVTVVRTGAGWWWWRWCGWR